MNTNTLTDAELAVWLDGFATLQTRPNVDELLAEIANRLRHRLSPQAFRAPTRHAVQHTPKGHSRQTYQRPTMGY